MSSCLSSLLFISFAFFLITSGSCLAEQPCKDDPNAHCERYKDQCNNATLIPLLRDACPVTCNLCPPTEAPCEDNKDTDCASMLEDCTNPLYIPLMREYCPVTCNLCSITLSPTTRKTTVARTKAGQTTTAELGATTVAPCEDDKNTDCTALKDYCNVPKEAAVMKALCPVTCNLCSVTEAPTAVSAITAKPSSSNPTVANCYDSSPACKQWAADGYCNQCIYSCAERTSRCGKTCGFCQKGACREC